MKLTNIACKNAKCKPDGKPIKLTDGDGLYLLVNERGKYWRMNYRFLGKQKTLAIGVYPEIGLAEAREHREEARKLLRADCDPNEIKKMQKNELRQDYDNNLKSIAEEWIEWRSHHLKAEHKERIMARLARDVFPPIGFRPLKSLTPPEILAVVRKVEARGTHDLARRLLQYIAQICRYAVSCGYIPTDPTVSLSTALKPIKSKRLAYLKESELPAFLKELEQYDGKYNGHTLTKLAFKLLILTFLRSGEIRGGKWSEIDWDRKLWRVPAERMKMNEEHLVPLCSQSIAILEELRDISANYSEFIFPAQTSPRCHMSENTFLRAIKIMGYDGKTTGHGFRSTASTILNENGFRSDVIERQLAHCERNQIRAAYNHAEYLTERTEMMQWWGDYIEGVGRCS